MSESGKVNSGVSKAYDARVPSVEDYRRPGNPDLLAKRVSTFEVGQPNAGEIFNQQIQSGQVRNGGKPNPDRVMLEAATGVGEAAQDLGIKLEDLEYLQNLADKGELPDGF